MIPREEASTHEIGSVAFPPAQFNDPRISLFFFLSSLVRSIPKHNLLVIGGDMNAQIGKNRNNKYSLYLM